MNNSNELGVGSDQVCFEFYGVYLILICVCLRENGGDEWVKQIYKQPECLQECSCAVTREASRQIGNSPVRKRCITVKRLQTAPSLISLHCHTESVS